jgi:hypothetical protein
MQIWPSIFHICGFGPEDTIQDEDEDEDEDIIKTT